MTPIDVGDVCLNYDKAWFAEHGVAPPTSLDDLTKPEYKDLLVVENPATSSPGLAFMLGHDRPVRRGRLARLLEAARRRTASRSHRAGTRRTTPTSPAARARARSRSSCRTRRARPPRSCSRRRRSPDAPTAVIESTCFRQVEFAGVLAGTKHAAAAQAFIDFMLSTTFQDDMPLNMFVYPVSTKATLPDVFVKYSVVPEHALVAARRTRSRRTATSGSTSGHRPCSVDAPRPAGRHCSRCPLAFLAVFFVWPVAAIIEPRHRRGRLSRGLHRRPPAPRRLVHALAGDGLDAPDAADRAARRLRAVALPLRRPLGRAGARDRAVRAADRRRRRRVHPHPARDRFDHTVWAILIAHVFFNYAVVVRVVGGLWANLDPRLDESAAMLGAPRWRSLLEVDLPLLAPAIAAASVDRVPLHVHVVRRGAAPRRPAPLDARGRDLPADRAAARPPGRRGPRARAARRGRRAARRLDACCRAAWPCNGGCAGATRRAPRSAPRGQRVLLVGATSP